LDIGRPVHIDIFDSNKIYKTEVAVIRKEKVELPGRGQIDAVVVRPRLLSEGLFQFSGEILIWLTDDDERIPVKVETTAPIGTVVARIASLETE
ncbi:MAG TPA: DUF3108 domain-containing protein, partial [Dissulfurispiraceae bacterium]|nr:DUF3108 domain-containing protein [Dissulfurispiraceae bacterium]